MLFVYSDTYNEPLGWISFDVHRLIIKSGVNNEVIGSPNIVIPVNKAAG